MTIKQIHYFIAVAETKSFTNAARNYFIAQVRLWSQQISALAKELGFSLVSPKQSFRRTDAGLGECSMTSSGLWYSVWNVPWNLPLPLPEFSPPYFELVFSIRPSTVFWPRLSMNSAKQIAQRNAAADFR